MAVATRKTNWFAIWVSVAVVAVIVAIGVLVVWMNNAATYSGPAPESSNVDTEAGAIVFGDGPDVVETYVDFMCPYCGRFEGSEGETIKQLVAEDKITLQVHPVAVLDNASQGTEYSSRAAGAMFAVATAHPEKAYAFLEAMFDKQPEESTPGLSDEEIVDIARTAGVEMTPELEASITTGEYKDYAQSLSLPEGARGTPTLVVNGETVPVSYDPQADIVARLG